MKLYVHSLFVVAMLPSATLISMNINDAEHALMDFKWQKMLASRQHELIANQQCDDEAIIKKKYDSAKIHLDKKELLQAIRLFEQVAKEPLVNATLAAKASYYLGRIYTIQGMKSNRYHAQLFFETACDYFLNAKNQEDDGATKARAHWSLWQLHTKKFITFAEAQAENYLKQACAQNYCKQTSTVAAWNLAQIYFAKPEKREGDIILAKYYCSKAALQKEHLGIAKEATEIFTNYLTTQLNKTNCRAKKASFAWELSEFYFNKSEAIEDIHEVERLKIAAKDYLLIAKNQTDNPQCRKLAQEKCNSLS